MLALPTKGEASMNLSDEMIERMKATAQFGTATSDNVFTGWSLESDAWNESTQVAVDSVMAYAPIPRRQGRPPGPPRVAARRLDARAESGRSRAPRPVRAPAHPCVVRDRGRRVAVRTRPVHGHE